MRRDLAAHQRLLASTPPERIRTHLRLPIASMKGYATPINDELLARYKAMKSSGKGYREIRHELHASTVLMARLSKMASE